MDYSMPGFPVHHQFPELTQTHIQRVGDTIQPSHPLSSPSPPAFNLSWQEEKIDTSFIYSSFKNRGLTNLTEVQARLVYWNLQNIVKWEFSSVQSFSCVQLFVTPWTAARQASLSITNSWSLPRLVSIESVMPSNHLILCHPLLLPPSVSPSIKVFSNESVLCIRWPKYWSFSFNISPSNEHSGLISFRMEWFDLLAVWGTLQSLLQHHCSKASILWHSAFFIVQLSHPYMTTGKTIALTRQTFVGKVMSLLFNMLSRFVITFLPRSKCLLHENKKA